MSVQCRKVRQNIRLHFPEVIFSNRKVLSKITEALAHFQAKIPLFTRRKILTRSVTNLTKIIIVVLIFLVALNMRLFETHSVIFINAKRFFQANLA